MHVHCVKQVINPLAHHGDHNVFSITIISTIIAMNIMIITTSITIISTCITTSVVINSMITMESIITIAAIIIVDTPRVAIVFIRAPCVPRDTPVPITFVM